MFPDPFLLLLLLVLSLTVSREPRAVSRLSRPRERRRNVPGTSLNVAGTSLNVAERRGSRHGNVAFVPALPK